MSCPLLLILWGGVAGPGLDRAGLGFATLTALGASALDAMELASAPPIGAEVPMNLGALLLCDGSLLTVL